MQKWLAFFLILTLAGCGDNKDNDEQAAIPVSSVEEELQAAAARYPDSLLLRENLIQYYRENSNYELALKEAANALGKDSNNARLWDIKGVLHSENEDTLAAIAAFEKAVELNADPSYVISLGTLYAQVKSPKAIDMANALILAEKARADKEALFIKGLYHSAIGEKEKAIGFFDQCLAIDYSFMYAYREKCIALYDLQKYEEALAVINKAVTLQNGYEEGYFYRGKCLEKLNRTADAIESYQTALMYAPDYIEAKEALSKLGVKS